MRSEVSTEIAQRCGKQEGYSDFDAKAHVLLRRIRQVLLREDGFTKRKLDATANPQSQSPAITNLAVFRSRLARSIPR